MHGDGLPKVEGGESTKNLLIFTKNRNKNYNERRKAYGTLNTALRLCGGLNEGRNPKSNVCILQVYHTDSGPDSLPNHRPSAMASVVTAK